MSKARKLHKIELAVHVLMLVLLYSFLMLTYPEQVNGRDDLLFYYIVSFDFLVFCGCAYFAAYVLLPKYFIKQRYLPFFLAFIGLVLAGSLLIAINDIILLRFFGEEGETEKAWNLMLFFVSTSGLTFMISLVGVGLRGITYWLQSIQQLNEIRKEKLQTELAFLRSQMNPHFLFNTINLVFGHIDKSNKTARDIIIKFSDLLRYQLYECDADFIPVEKELKYLDNYIQLQRLRKTEQLKCELNFSGPLSGFSIPPLLLIPFVENAFKHVGTGTDQTSFIRINVARTNGEFHFNCANSSSAITSEDVIRTGGLGLVNVQRRLEIMYPERHTLTIKKDPNSFDVALTLVL
jgi:LytS/YehU family sensor histidine kinase